MAGRFDALQRRETALVAQLKERLFALMTEE
jgi:hypothetical protein